MFARLRAMFKKPEPPAGSTTCAHCLKPIVPGMHVAAAWVGAPHPYTHANWECDESGGGFYAGTWGQGKLVPHPALVFPASLADSETPAPGDSDARAA